MKPRIKVGSRKSDLAFAQTQWVINQIKKNYPDIEFEIIGIQTQGDTILDRTLDKTGGKGLFVKELENALLERTIDFAVHSVKDIPVQIPDDLTIAAVSKREDPRDVLITLDGKDLDRLPAGAVVGTSSPRREAQLLQKRSDLHIKMLRGNVFTRIGKLAKSEYDAIILAAAGLKRLGYENPSIRYFDVETMIPAVGQGILGLEARKDDEVNELLRSIHCEKSSTCLAAERAFMIKLNGGCSTPIAAHAVIDTGRLKVYGLLASDDKQTVFKEVVEGVIGEDVRERSDEATRLGEKLAEMILAKMEPEVER
jgi:hydroxymethylbilane synthase